MLLATFGPKTSKWQAQRAGTMLALKRRGGVGAALRIHFIGWHPHVVVFIYTIVAGRLPGEANFGVAELMGWRSLRLPTAQIRAHQPVTSSTIRRTFC